jgi:hypothetical protein
VDDAVRGRDDSPGGVADHQPGTGIDRSGVSASTADVDAVRSAC